MSEQPTNPANTDEAAAAIDVQDGAGTDQIPENAELDLVMGNIDCNQPPEERVKTGHSEETLVNNDEELAQEVAAMEPQRLRNPLRVRIKRIPQHARQLGKMVQKDGLQKASANFRGWFFDTGINKLKGQYILSYSLPLALL